MITHYDLVEMLDNRIEEGDTSWSDIKIVMTTVGYSDWSEVRIALQSLIDNDCIKRTDDLEETYVSIGHVH